MIEEQKEKQASMLEIAQGIILLSSTSFFAVITAFESMEYFHGTVLGFFLSGSWGATCGFAIGAAFIVIINVVASFADETIHPFYGRDLDNANVSFPEGKILSLPLHYKLLKVSSYLFSIQTQTDILRPLAAEWEFDYYRKLESKNFWQARWTNFRWAYHFLLVMVIKSPLYTLIKFFFTILFRLIVEVIKILFGLR